MPLRQTRENIVACSANEINGALQQSEQSGITRHVKILLHKTWLYKKLSFWQE